MFGVVDDTTTTKFANRPCAVHGISLPVVVDKFVAVVLKVPIAFVLGPRVVVCAVITANCVNRSVRCCLTNGMGYPSEEKMFYF